MEKWEFKNKNFIYLIRFWKNDLELIRFWKSYNVKLTPWTNQVLKKPNIHPYNQTDYRYKISRHTSYCSKNTPYLNIIVDLSHFEKRHSINSCKDKWGGDKKILVLFLQRIRLFHSFCCICTNHFKGINGKTNLTK